MQHVIADLDDEKDHLLDKVAWEIRESDGVIGFYATFLDNDRVMTKVTLRVMKIINGVVVVRSDYMESLGLKMSFVPAQELLDRSKVMKKGE